MCQFNNIVLPATTNLDELKEIFKQYNFAPTQIYNESLQQQLTEKIFVIPYMYGCNCGSVISSAQSKDDQVSLRDKEIIKLEQKGWSQTKINNYLNNKARSKSHQVDNRDQDRIRWYEFIKETLKTTKIKSLGILTHWYQGDISTEAINVTLKCKIKLAEFKPEQLDEFQRDVYYEIRA